jgi:uncharacterized membrane protein
VKWVNGVASLLGEYSTDTESTALKCSGNGSVIVGDSHESGVIQRAVYWDTSGVHVLQGFFGGTSNTATGISYDGKLISGYGQDAAAALSWPLVWRDTVLSVMPLGVVSGAELVTNGGFTGGSTGWTLGADASYGSNKVTVLDAGGDTKISQNTIASVSGTIYELTFTISGSAPPGAGAIWFFNNNSIFTGATYTTGTYTEVFEADFTGTDTLVFKNSLGNAGDTWSLDNVSLKAMTATVQPSLNLEVQNISPDGEVIMGQGAYNPGALKAGAIEWLCA